MIKIDFGQIYEPEEIADDLSCMVFHAPVKGGCSVRIKVNIEPLDDPFLPGVYNLAFGLYQPGEASGQGTDLDDLARIRHADTGRVFSTVLLFGLTFLRANPDLMLGFDGSTESRAYLYHRMFRANASIMREHFVTLGVDWYVRLKRNNMLATLEDGALLLKPQVEPFNEQRPASDPYRYYIFYLFG